MEPGSELTICLAGLTGQFHSAEVVQRFLNGQALAAHHGSHRGRHVMSQGLLIVVQGVLFSGLALGQKPRIVFGTDAGLQLAPASLLRSALVAGAGRLAVQAADLLRQLVRKVGALPMPMKRFRR